MASKLGLNALHDQPRLGPKPKITGEVVTQLIINQKTQEIIATAFGNNSKHDFQPFKDGHSILTSHICSLADAGYQGLKDWHENAQAPAKKSKLYLLIQEQKASNRKLSHERILVENVIRRLKISRILSDRYRIGASVLRFAST